MFRTILICAAFLSVTGYSQEWERLENVPVPVQRWSCITYSYDEWGTRPYDTVWGIFPAGVEDGKTYFLYYDCSNGHWYYPHDSVINADFKYTALTFQWLEGGVVFFIGMSLNGDFLYWYPLRDGSWHLERIDAFTLGPRPGLAFQPNPNYNLEVEPIPGWLYCLAGGGQQFWRYWISSSLAPVAVDGIYPPHGSLIDWGAAVHTFQLRGGWERLRDVPRSVTDGAALVYTGGLFPGGTFYAFVGGGDTSWFTYVVENNVWLQLTGSTPPQNIGTALASGSFPDVSYGSAYGIFGEHSSQYLHHYSFGGWRQWGDLIPEALGPGASIAAGRIYLRPIYRYIYLISGEEPDGRPRSHFWRIAGPEFEGDRGFSSQSKSGQTMFHTRVNISTGSVVLEYFLGLPANVKAAVYDALGRQVKVLYAAAQSAGAHRLKWNPKVPAAYFIVLNTGKEQAKLKVVVR